jgi:hypothetical protein
LFCFVKSNFRWNLQCWFGGCWFISHHLVLLIASEHIRSHLNLDKLVRVSQFKLSEGN